MYDEALHLTGNGLTKQRCQKVGFESTFEKQTAARGMGAVSAKTDMRLRVDAAAQTTYLSGTLTWSRITALSMCYMQYVTVRFCTRGRAEIDSSKKKRFAPKKVE